MKMGHVSSLRSGRETFGMVIDRLQLYLVLVIIMQVAAYNNCQGVRRAISSKLHLDSTVLGDLYHPPLINFNDQGGSVNK